MESANRKRSSEPVRGGPGPFKIRTVRFGDGEIIRLLGELDSAGCPSVDEAIRDAEESGIGAVVIDLTDLEFLDSTGLSVLMEARKRSKENGGRIHFIPSQQPNVTRLLEITGTVEMLR